MALFKVLTYTQINISENFPLIEAFLKSLFASKIILFVGYSFSDIDLKMIIQRVRGILGVNFQNSYLLNTDSNFHPTQREYLKSKGVNVINYHDAIENEKNYIEEYLKGNNAFKESYILESNKLSYKGQELLNFLRFINYYDAFVEPLSRLDIVQQAHLSLERFVEFNTIPPDFLANLFPFNIKKNYVNHYSNGDLLTHNEDLTNIFYNLLEYDEKGFIKTEKGEIVFDDSKITYIEFSKNKYKQLLPSIINKLNNSFIFRIYEKGPSPDSFGNYGKANQGKYLGTSNSFDAGYKKTLMYKYDQFQFTELINTLDNLSINDTSDLKIDMELAYFNHKIGNFYVSYKQFEEIANKAWQMDKYITYFIAKNNVKKLTG